MPNSAAAPKTPPTVPPTYHLLPAVLSYLVPGLGQIYQGRVGKGVLFFVCIYALFFYGMALGHWENVYIPQDAFKTNTFMPQMGPVAANLWTRPQYLGQFWVGIAAWPAIIQYNSIQPNFLLRDFQRTPPESELNLLQTNGDKTWDLGWVYTVIAGVLNIMVIYDALTGPAFLVNPSDAAKKEATTHARAARS
jgi:hypothetical protein